MKISCFFATVLLSFVLSFLVPLAAPTNVSWTNVRIGGGGYVTGAFFHPVDPLMYFKTDVGGMYRRSLSSGGGLQDISWIPLLDFLSGDESDYYSVSHVAVSPFNGSTVWTLLGGNPAWSACKILKSIDAGNTWTELLGPGNWSLGCNGNGGDRGMGDRLIVHPTNPDILLVAGYDGHVYVSLDGIANGNQSITNITFPNVPYPIKESVRTVTFMPIPALSTYAAIAVVPGYGIYWNPGPNYATSSDWSIVTGLETLGNISRFLVDNSNPSVPYLYSTFTGGFARLSTQNSNNALQIDWIQTPSDNHTYDGLAYNPYNPLDITFLSIGTDSTTTFQRSLDGGKTFFIVNWTTISSVPWANNNSYGLKLNAASTFTHDPHSIALFNNTQVWVTDFFGLWRCENWDAPANAAKAGTDPATVQVLFTNVEWGHEEVCYNYIKAPAYGLPFSGVADDFGWLHNNGLDQYPTSVYPTKDAHNCGFAGDYTLTASSNNQFSDTVWITGGDEYGSCRYNWCGSHHYVGYSKDGGYTFTETNYDAQVPGSNSYPYRLLTHPFNGSIAVITGYQGMPLVYTHDYGNTWNNASSADNNLLQSIGPWGNFWWALPFAKDNNADPAGSPSTPATFYYYNGTNALFTSVDSGVTWSLTYKDFPTWNVPLFAIATPPRGTASVGDIWAFAGWQLHHSTNGGYNFSGVWEFYSVKDTITVGPLPNVSSTRTGRSAAELSAVCANHRLPESRRPKGAPIELLENDRTNNRSYPYPSSYYNATTGVSSPAYVVYSIGTVTYGPRVGVHVSIDYGMHWIELTTVNQGLGDSPTVCEASLSSPGTVFVGTDGRGVFYADISGVLLEALMECEKEYENSLME